MVSLALELKILGVMLGSFSLFKYDRPVFVTVPWAVDLVFSMVLKFFDPGI